MKDSKTHWKKQFNYEYLGTYSLPADGKDLTLTVKQTKKEMVTGNNGQKEECFVCYFQEEPKPMILNRTNCGIIEKIYKTPFIEEWTGKKIQLYAKKVSAFGEMVDGLRIRELIPKTEKPELTKELVKPFTNAIIYYQQNKHFQAIEKRYKLSDDTKQEIINAANIS